jgi:hypothetical protein
MPLQETSGNVTADAYGGGVAAIPNYIEDVFSTYLYTGNSSTQTITNGIDLSGKGGLVWLKKRGPNANYGNPSLWDTVRGVNKVIYSDQTTLEQNYSPYGLTAFSSTGFSVSDPGNYGVNGSGDTYASWTFRKQPKFFDVVTYTGDGAATRNISHNLGSTPGFILVKCTSTTGSWVGYHRSLGATYVVILNSTSAAVAGTPIWDSTEPTSTQFTVNNNSFVNTNGATYVAYLFAHNAGGFGLTGTDNVISCGSYTGNGGLNPINLGYEAQWVLIKNASTGGATSNWQILDNMRGFSNNGTDQPQLRPNTSEAESSSAQLFASSTGFTLNDGSSRVNGSGETYIYIAIRRGPMKVPTDATKVFAPALRNPTQGVGYYSGFPVDLNINRNRVYDPGAGGVYPTDDRLRGGANFIWTNTTDAENGGSGTRFQSNVGYYPGLTGANSDQIDWMFRRAPSFFDEVCYTGTGSNRTITHNLTVAPELIIVKRRDSAEVWPTWSSAMAYGSNNYLNYASAVASGNTDVLNYWDTVAVPPTSTTFAVGTHVRVNASGGTYVAYLFATCAGVSKVGSYTGNGSSQTINCGFTGGARFILIKQTTTASNEWFVWDTARGIVSGNDPLLALNRTWAEDSTTDSVDTDSSGFIVNQNSTTSINNNGETYIFLAIA